MYAAEVVRDLLVADPELAAALTDPEHADDGPRVFTRVPADADVLHARVDVISHAWIRADHRASIATVQVSVWAAALPDGGDPEPAVNDLADQCSWLLARYGIVHRADGSAALTMTDAPVPLVDDDRGPDRRVYGSAVRGDITMRHTTPTP